VGSVLRVLAERPSRKNSGELFGYNEFNENVVFKGSSALTGKFVMVKIEKVSGQTLVGVLAE
jgi:tRNA A37 methylthiotransferase MiaB